MRAWTFQDSDTRVAITSVDFLNRDLGWGVGMQGTLIHTRDGGNTWMYDGPVTDQDLWSLFFFTPLRGWAVGEKGTILQFRD